MVVGSALLHETINVWLEAAPCRGRHTSATVNVSKPYQSPAHPQSGFPRRRLITNDPEQVRAFARGTDASLQIDPLCALDRSRMVLGAICASCHIADAVQRHIDGIDVRATSSAIGLRDPD
jgi:hypothetical protein